MALQDRLDAFKADFETNKAPASVVAIMRKATADLTQSGQADRALEGWGGRSRFPIARRAWKSRALGRPFGARTPRPDLLSRGLVPYRVMDLQAIEDAADEIRVLEPGCCVYRRRPPRTAASRKGRTR